LGSAREKKKLVLTLRKRRERAKNFLWALEVKQTSQIRSITARLSPDNIDHVIGRVLKVDT